MGGSLGLLRFFLFLLRFVVCLLFGVLVVVWVGGWGMGLGCIL